MTAGGTPLDRVRAIERDRVVSTLVAHGQAIGVAVLLYASFAVGHQLGPTPLGLGEATLGASFALLVGFVVARPLARRRRDGGARARYRLEEGRARRRVLVYDDYVLIDEEPVLRVSVERVDRAADHLVLRYQDPVAGGPLLRELGGPARGLDAVADALSPQTWVEPEAGSPVR